MNYKRTTNIPAVERFNGFVALCNTLDEFGISADDFFDWLEPQLKRYIEIQTGQFNPVAFDEKKRTFGDNDMPRKVAKVDLNQDQNQLIAEWKQKSDQLAQLKADEAALRTKLVEKLFTATKLEGTESIDIGWGYRLKASKSLNISATNASKQTENLLNAIWPIDQTLATNLVSWKPDVSSKNFRELMDTIDKMPEGEQKNAVRTALAAAITVKPGMPELEMIAPKETPTVESTVPVPDGGTVTTDGSGVKW